MVDVDAGAASPPALARQQRLAAIVESSEDAIIARTLDGTITEWNGAAERLFGYTAAEAIGQPISILFPFDCIDDPARTDELLQSGRGLERHETVRVRKDGSRVYVSATVSPISDASGALVGAAIIARDITRDRLAEEERAQLFEREQAARAEAERARERLTFIGRASAALVSSLDYAATIQGVARLLVPGFADWCLVDLLEGGRLRRVAAAHVDPELEQAQLHLWDERRMDLAGPHPVARVLRSGQPLFDSVVPPTALESFAQDAGHRQVLRQLATASRIVLPLTARGAVFGALSLAHTSASNRRYSAEDLALAQELARWASIAIDHARLYAAEQGAPRTCRACGAVDGSSPGRHGGILARKQPRRGDRRAGPRRAGCAGRPGRRHRLGRPCGDNIAPGLPGGLCPGGGGALWHAARGALDAHGRGGSHGPASMVPQPR